MKKSELKTLIVETLNEFGLKTQQKGAIKNRLVSAQTDINDSLRLLKDTSKNEITHIGIRKLSRDIEKIIKGLG